jgi:hypothetical protein
VAAVQIARNYSRLFWVAQRFTAAITALFSSTALAAEGDAITNLKFGHGFWRLSAPYRKI